MMKHMYHEEIGGGYGMRRKTIIDTSEIEPGKFETMALVDATGDELESVITDNAQDAKRDFLAMIQRHALPLQAAFYRAEMIPGERYTLVFLGEFGFPVDLRITFREAHLTTYAQYDDAVSMTFMLKKKRNPRRMCLYNRSFLIYSGWRDLDASATYNVHKCEDGISVMSSKYGSFDERFMDDIKAMWPDYIVAYDHDRVHRMDDEPVAEVETDEQTDAPSQAYPLLPGISVVFDEEGVDGPCIEMDMDEFGQLYAVDADQIDDPVERLAWALKRAAIASVSVITEQDGGTCNFDSPALYYAACGISRAEAQGAVESVGLHCHEWQPFRNRRGDDGKIVKAPTYLVISGFQSGQGNRRTKMAEAFCQSLTSDGFETQMYYQMD